MSTFEAQHYSDIHLGELARWYRPAHLEEALNSFPISKFFERFELGTSYEGRPIKGYIFGKGPARLLLWSQMHGNEPTATHALLEIMGMLCKPRYAKQAKSWQKALTICFIPMLNPDGAERFTRHNAQLIDMNRDAVARQTPEMQAFFAFVQQYKPHWAFNLHDQRNIFSVGNTKLPATLSFLSPSASEARDITQEREMSMCLIDKMLQQIKPHAKDYLARFTDEYYPKALGEFFHRNQIPCVLLESGPGYKDPLRLKARKLNVLALLEAFERIATDSVGYSTQYYEALPLNTHQNLDIIIRHSKIKTETGSYKADIGLLLKEIPDEATGQLKSVYLLEEVGDLDQKGALREIEGAEVQVTGDFALGKPANMLVEVANAAMKFENGLLM